MRKHTYIQKGQVSKLTVEQAEKSYVKLYDLDKHIETIIEDLSVPNYNTCCDLASTVFPVRFNSTTSETEYFNGTAWTTSSSILSSTGLVALAGGGQTGATALTRGFNEIITSATAGDSVILPAASDGGSVIVKNDGATAIDVFPPTSGTINDGSANAAVRVAPQAVTIFRGINTTNWETDREVVAVADGTVGAPSFTFNTQPNMGLRKVSSTQLGISVSGTLVGGANATGLFTDNIVEQTTSAGVTVGGALLKSSSIALGDGTVSNLAVKLGADLNNGIYGVSDTQLGIAVEGALVSMFDTVGLKTNSIGEQTTGAGISLEKATTQKRTATAKNSTGSASAAELALGLITSTSAAAVALTLPTASLLATQLGAVQGTTFEFIVDNSAGSNTVTVTVNTGITVVTPVLTGSDTLTVASGVAAMFRIYFTSATVAKLSRVF